MTLGKINFRGDFCLKKQGECLTTTVVVFVELLTRKSNKRINSIFY